MAPSPTPGPAGRVRAWTPFTVMALVIGLALMSSATPTPLYVDYQSEWGTGGTVITFVYAVYSLAVLIPLLFLGRLSDAIGRKPVVLAGLALVGVSMLLLATAPDVARLVAARVVQGVGVGLVSGAAGAAVVELHPTRDARIGALTTGASMNFGITVGVLLAGFVAMWSPAPLVYPYVVVGALVVVLLIAVLALVPETVAVRAGALRAALRPQRIAVPAAARSTFALACVCVIASWSVGGVFLGLGGALARDIVGRSDYLITALVVASLQAAAAIAQLVWNLTVGGGGGSAALRRGVTLGVTMLIIGLAGASLAVEARTALWLIVAGAVIGAGMGLLFLMGSTLAARNVLDGVRGEVLSAFFVVAYLSLAVPAVIAAVLAEFVGLTNAYHLLALAASVVAVGALVTVRRARV